MTEQHRAKPEVWAAVEKFSKNDMDISMNCLLELRDRVEALEAAAKPAESNDPAEPNSSLVGRRPWAAMSFRGSMLLPPPDCADPDLWIAERIYEMGFTAGKNAATGNTAPVTRDRDETGDYVIVHDAPASSDSLVKEVVDAITDVYAVYGTADEFTCRAAIHAIANWLDQQKLHIAATELRREVE